MSHSGSRAAIPVCSVAQNSLAEAYLEQLLRAHPGVQPLNLKQYLGLSPLRRKDVVFIIDQFGFEMPLYDCLKQLRGYCSAAEFIVLDQHKSNEEIVRILVMGAHGYVPHAAAPTTLIRAIFSVSANQLWVPPEVLSEFLCVVSRVLHKGAQTGQMITPRENEILELMRRRLSNREIAEALEIRVSTVKFHVSNILSKLHAKNRRELTEATRQNLWNIQLQ